MWAHPSSSDTNEGLLVARVPSRMFAIAPHIIGPNNTCAFLTPWYDAGSCSQSRSFPQINRTLYRRGGKRQSNPEQDQLSSSKANVQLWSRSAKRDNIVRRNGKLSQMKTPAAEAKATRGFNKLTVRCIHTVIRPEIEGTPPKPFQHNILQ